MKITSKLFIAKTEYNCKHLNNQLHKFTSLTGNKMEKKNTQPTPKKRLLVKHLKKFCIAVVSLKFHVRNLLAGLRNRQLDTGPHTHKSRNCKYTTYTLGFFHTGPISAT